MTRRAGEGARPSTTLERDAGGHVLRLRTPLPNEPTFRPYPPEPTPAPTARRFWRGTPQLLFVLLPTLLLGCAHLESFATRADAVRQEVADTLLALQAIGEHCAQMQEPKPAICEQADELEQLLQEWPGQVR